MAHDLEIGTDAAGQRVTLCPEDLRHKNFHVLGLPGLGKTFWVAHVLTQLILRRVPVLVVDFKGDLFDLLLRFAVSQRLNRRTVVVDPLDAVCGSRRAVGINGLDDPGPPSAVAGQMKTSLKLLFGQATQVNPWLDDVASLLLNLLTQSRAPGEAPWTIFEAPVAASLEDAAFRAHLLTRCPDPFLRQRFAQLAPHGPRALAEMFNPFVNRVAQLAYSHALRAIVGQRRTTIDLDAMLRPQAGGLLLVKAFDPHLAPDELDFLGSVVVERIKAAVFRRPKRHYAAPVYLVVDEVQRLCGGRSADVGLELADALERGRSFGLRAVLIHQHLSQLLPPGSPQDTRVQDAIIEICKARAYFGIGRRSAEVVWGEVYADAIEPMLNERKHTVSTLTVLPRETTRTIRSTSRSQGDQWSETHSDDAAVGEVSGSSDHFGPDGLFACGPLLGSGSTLATSSGTRSGHGRAAGGSAASGESESVVPFLEPQLVRQEGGVTFVDLNQVKERCIRALTVQAPRQLVFKHGTAPAVALVSTTLALPPLLDRQVARFRRELLARHARPTDEVLLELTERVPKFLAASAAARPDPAPPGQPGDAAACVADGADPWVERVPPPRRGRANGRRSRGGA